MTIQAHTASGQEIVGWTAPQPPHPIVRATPRPMVADDVLDDTHVPMQPTPPPAAPSGEQASAFADGYELGYDHCGAGIPCEPRRHALAAHPSPAVPPPSD